MANEEQYMILLEDGVKGWNKWRKKNPDIRPDLTGEYIGRELSGANFSEADLSGANLNEADLSEADLSEADLSGADLSGADLSEADLSGADLSGADLSGANLSGADLGQANLFRADLSRTNLSKAELRRVNFSSAKLTDANLQNADLRRSLLIKCNLTSAVLTGCKLYGTARDDWVIEGVKCSCIYFDYDCKAQLPKGREFEEGEFERLYASLPTIEYFFQNGFSPMDPVIMSLIVQAIQEKEPDFGIQIDSINVRGLVPSMKFNVKTEEQKAAALEQVTSGYEGRIRRLEGKTVQHEIQKVVALKQVTLGHEGRIRRLEGKLETLQDMCYRFIDRPTKETYIINNRGIIAIDGSTISIEHHACMELEKVISSEPKGSKSFGKIAKDKAMDIIGGATEDVAKGLVKEAGKKIVELGIELGPVLMKTAAYAFFKSMLG